MTFSVFTYQESTIPTRSVKQAYEHAAVIIRSERGLPLGDSEPVYPAETYDSSNDSKILTLEQFSNLVNSIVKNFL